MNGDDIRTARDALNLSRPQLADMLNITVGALARCEMRGPKPEEEDRFEELLRKAGVVPSGAVESSSDPGIGLPPAPTGTAALDDFDKGQVVSTEWGGLRRGQICRLDGPHGVRVKFGHHFKSVTQEYVEVFSTKNGGAKPVRPERIWGPNGQVALKDNDKTEDGQ